VGDIIDTVSILYILTGIMQYRILGMKLTIFDTVTFSGCGLHFTVR